MKKKQWHLQLQSQYYDSCSEQLEEQLTLFATSEHTWLVLKHELDHSIKLLHIVKVTIADLSQLGLSQQKTCNWLQ